MTRKNVPGIPEVVEDVKKFLNSPEIRPFKAVIQENIDKRLYSGLFTDHTGKKEALKGGLKGAYSVRVGGGYVAIYIIEGDAEKHAVITHILTESMYHDWMKLYNKKGMLAKVFKFH